MPRFPIRLNPVVDPVYTGDIFLYETCGSATTPIGKADKNMREDVEPASGNPWNKIFGDPFLVPSPLLAALPALPAVLRHGYGISSVECVGHDGPAFSLAADERYKKTISFFVRELF